MELLDLVPLSILAALFLAAAGAAATITVMFPVLSALLSHHTLTHRRNP
jgi:hypothetical protein